MNRTARPLAAGIVLGALVGGGLVTPALAATPVEVTFAYTGAEQQFVVPDGVTSIHVVLIGAHGGGSPDSTQLIHAGLGAQLTADQAVASGTTLFVEVGGNGGIGTAGFNGGGSSTWMGGGGGASDLRTISRSGAGSLASRLLVAAGGGGVGWGSGGNAGDPGSDSGNGLAHGGGAGTVSSGGTGGTGDFADGSDGSAGEGGQGGINAGIHESGGGGGAGLFGGGGGGQSVLSTGAAGGGGGSSYTGDATNASVGIYDIAPWAPSITISYTPASGGGGGSDSGTVAADVTVPSAALCLQLSTASISFGTLALGTENAPATPDIVVTNCGGSDEALLASGTDATGTNAAWTLVDSSATCADTLGIDAYRLELATPGGAPIVGLTAANQAVGPLAAAGSVTHVAHIWTACPGSSGAGTTMALAINYLATAP